MKEFKSYDLAVEGIWHREATGLKPELDNVTAEALQDLVHYGRLAASSHNTQCWKFRVNADTSSVTVLPDIPSRRCPVVDPDNHHLYASLGCAVENMVIAANAHGLETKVDSSTPDAGGVRVTFSRGVTKNTELFRALPNRQTTRTEYDGQALTESEMEVLRLAGNGKGVKLVILTEQADRDTVTEFVVRANMAQMTNKAFMNELRDWIRFGENDALETGDGLYGKTMGRPEMPAWIGRFFMPFVVSPKKESDAYVKQLKSSAGVAVFVSEKDDLEHWVEVGRCYERFAVQAAALGVRNALINMPVEEADIRPNFMKALNLDGPYARIDLVVRFGRAPDMPPSLRRPLKDIIVE